jgi:hypothetical protein
VPYFLTPMESQDSVGMEEIYSAAGGGGGGA